MIVMRSYAFQVPEEVGYEGEDKAVALNKSLCAVVVLVGDGL
jgi:hypothetical protein